MYNRGIPIDTFHLSFIAWYFSSISRLTEHGVKTTLYESFFFYLISVYYFSKYDVRANVDIDLVNKEHVTLKKTSKT